MPNVWKRFGSINDFAHFSLTHTPPSDDNLKQVAGELYAQLTEVGYDPLDPCAVEGLHMASFEIDDSAITVGLCMEQGPVWCLHTQMLVPGLFQETRKRRLAVLDRLNRALHDALIARPDLNSLEWLQDWKAVSKQGTAEPMS